MTEKQKVLIAYYVPREQRFRIPKGLDLEDKTKVEEYWVRREQLHIKFVDGSFKHIQAYYDFYDEKTPCEENIETDDENTIDDWVSVLKSIDEGQNLRRIWYS